MQSENFRNVAARDRLAATYCRIGRIQIKLRDFQTATITLNRARTLADVEGASANANAQALYTMADSYSGLGEVEVALGTNTRQTTTARVEHWKNAISWYERSLTTWTQIKEPGLVSPDAFDAVPPTVVTQQLVLANKALGRLTAHK